MRWFIKDSKFYIGPVVDQEINRLMQVPALKEVGIACSASAEKVETYVTVPASSDSRAVLESLRFAEVS